MASTGVTFSKKARVCSWGWIHVIGVADLGMSTAPCGNGEAELPGP